MIFPNCHTYPNPDSDSNDAQHGNRPQHASRHFAALSCLALSVTQTDRTSCQALLPSLLHSFLVVLVIVVKVVAECKSPLAFTIGQSRPVIKGVTSTLKIVVRVSMGSRLS